MHKLNRLGIRILTEKDMGKYDVPKDPKQDRKRYPVDAFASLKAQINAYRGKE